ncbi:MAG: AAA family ATPase [Anaerolineae bacterium]|nr:AAA family ATPase [Anaerolineae bacterium]
MNCHSCNANNPDEAKFCMNCGSPMMVPCRHCGHTNPPLAKFCIECGNSLDKQAQKKEDTRRAAVPKEYAQKLEVARKAQTMQGERRIVSILFCDVKGSTSMAEKLDPEEWAEVMNHAFEYLIAPIYAYEGTLARLMGDSVLAFFGAPIAHEDDAQRAVLAGLQIIKSIQPFKEKITQKYKLDFDVRVGINTGLVVVGGVGSDLFMEYTALGDAINIAARMEQTAQPGTIQIWEDTYKLVAPFFETELVEGIEIKGKSEDGKVYRVLGMKEVQDSRQGIKGIEAPLTGRIDELNTLKQAISAVEKGRGQIVCLMGEAGLGKSRLLSEARQLWENADGDAQPFGQLSTRWNQTAGVSYEFSRPYGLIQRLIRNFIGITSSDTPERIKENLLETLAVNEVSFSPDQIDLLLMLLGVKESANGHLPSGEEFKRAVYKEMLVVLEMLVQKMPTVICIDDLHWSDPASAELIIHLFQLADRLPILFICAFRPERSSPAWMVKQEIETSFVHRYTEINLSPLQEDESSALVDELLTGCEFPQNIRNMILRKSDGNPFFMEEVVRTLIDNKVMAQDAESGNWFVAADIDNIAIPDNLQALLAARIDQLEESAKQVLQMASVIGRTFYHPVLEIINDATGELDNEITKLQRLGLILEADRKPYLEYFFRQALTHETAYNTILLKHRREFHKRVGEAMLQLYPDRLDEFGSVLGHHFYQALDPRAIRYFRAEGDAALNLYANQEAITFYTKAIEATKWAPSLDLDELIYLFSGRGRAYELKSQFSEALANYQELESIAIENNGKAAELAALILQALIYSVPNNEFNVEAGLSIVEKAKAIAEEINDNEAVAKIYWIEMNLYRFSHSLVAAQKIGEKAITAARDLGLEEQLAYSLNDTAHVYSMNGRVGRAREVSMEAIELWRKLANQPMLADCLSGLASLSVYSGNFDEAYQYSDEAYQISLRIENVWGQSYSRYVIGLVDLERGDFNMAIKQSQQSIRDAEISKFMAGELLGRAFLTIVHNEIGDYKTAAETIQIAIERTTENNAIVTAFSTGASFLVAVKAGRFEEAEAIISNYLSPDDDPHVIAKCYLKLGECYLCFEKGDYQAAAKIARDFNISLQEMGVRFITPELLMLYGVAHLKMGAFDVALESLTNALQVAQEIGSRRILWQIYYYLGEYDRQQGDHKGALNYFHKASEIVSYIVDGLEKPEQKELFLARAEARNLFELIEQYSIKE